MRHLGVLFLLVGCDSKTLVRPECTPPGLQEVEQAVRAFDVTAGTVGEERVVVGACRLSGPWLVHRTDVLFDENGGLLCARTQSFLSDERGNCPDCEISWRAKEWGTPSDQGGSVCTKTVGYQMVDDDLSSISQLGLNLSNGEIWSKDEEWQEESYRDWGLLAEGDLEHEVLFMAFRPFTMPFNE